MVGGDDGLILDLLCPTCYEARACLPHLQLLWPIKNLPTLTERVFRKMHIVHLTQIFFDLFLNLQLPDFGHRGDQGRECWGQREANHHSWKSKFTGRFFLWAGPRCLSFCSWEQRLILLLVHHQDLELSGPQASPQ